MKSLRQVLENLKPEDWDDLADGHSNNKPKFYEDLGFEKSHYEKYIKEFESDGTWKGSLWKDQGKALAVIAELRRIPKSKPIPKALEKRFNEVYIAKVKGIYNLTFVMGICNELNISFGDFIGRGFQAQECVRELKKFVGIKVVR